MFVLAAAEDEIVALPQALAAKSLCRATSVAVRVEPGRHLSLFMGQRTLGGAWREIARWLKGGGGGALRKAPAARSRLAPGGGAASARVKPSGRAWLRRGWPAQPRRLGLGG